MAEQRLLVVTDDLIDRVDSLRDGKSREQFLELAVLLVGELDQVRGDRARLEFVLAMRDQIEAQEQRIRELEQVTIGFLRSLEGQMPGWSLSSHYLPSTVTGGTPLAPTHTGSPPAPPVFVQQAAVAVQPPPPQQTILQPMVPVLAPVLPTPVAPAPQPVQLVQPVLVQPVAPAVAPVRDTDLEEERRHGESLWQEMSHRETTRREERESEDDEVETEVTTTTSRRREAGSETPEEAYNRAIFNILWLVAAVLYGFGDTVTSYLVFKVGGAEANPIMRFFLGLGGIPPFVAAKTLIMAGLFALSVFVFSPLKRSGWVIPIITAIGGGYLVVHNLIVLFSR